MTTEIICEVGFDKLKKLANDLEKEGFIPISMTSEYVDQITNYYTCILMHKKEYLPTKVYIHETPGSF